MQKNVLCLLFVLVTVQADYLASRTTLLQAEKSMATGGSIILTPKEKEANQILLNAKNAEFKDVDSFPPARHFFDAIGDIEKSKVFAIIQKLPKGASLHTHLTASVSLDYVFTNLLQRDSLYGCVIDGRLKLKFFAPSRTSRVCKWELIKDMRKKDAKFDNWAKGQMSLYSRGNPRPVYNSLNDIWKAFRGLFSTLYELIAYKSAFQDFLYQALKEHHDDNVFYVEFRANFPELYELNGTTYSVNDFLQTFSETVQRFRRAHPQFVGARMIYSPNRKINSSEMEQALNTFKSLKSDHPNVVAGFDLIGFEDGGRPLVDFHQQFKSAQSYTNFFFHAGETNWYGHDVDHNLVDAVLLGTKRIGHGYAILKHPKVLDLARQNDIAIELNPISNQILMYVDDLRNHPAASLIAQGFPVVVCNDDPGAWGAKGLSYDWYLVYMGMASRDAGLEFLKQLALNSLKYSSLPEAEKAPAIRDWNAAWMRFVEELIRNKGSY